MKKQLLGGSVDSRTLEESGSKEINTGFVNCSGMLYMAKKFERNPPGGRFMKTDQTKITRSPVSQGRGSGERRMVSLREV